MSVPALTLRIEMTPPREVMPNTRVPWYSRSRLVGKAEATRWLRQAARLAVMDTDTLLDVIESWPPRWKRARCQATIFWERGRRQCDNDNALAGLKAAFDGLTDVEIFSDDKHLTHLPVKQERDPDGLGYVLVEIWEGA